MISPQFHLVSQPQWKKENELKKKGYLYFGEFKLEEVGAAGSHKHGGEQLGVWFHLHHGKKTQRGGRRVIRKQRGSATCPKRLNGAKLCVLARGCVRVRERLFKSVDWQDESAAGVESVR